MVKRENWFLLVTLWPSHIYGTCVYTHTHTHTHTHTKQKKKFNNNKLLVKVKRESGMRAHTCNHSIWWAEPQESLQVQGQPGLQNEFQASQSYIGRHCQEQKQKGLVWLWLFERWYCDSVLAFVFMWPLGQSILVPKDLESGEEPA